MAKTSLEKTMAKLRISQIDLAMVQAENEFSMTDMDHSQDGLPRFYAQHEMSQPPQVECLT